MFQPGVCRSTLLTFQQELGATTTQRDHLGFWQFLNLDLQFRPIAEFCAPSLHHILHSWLAPTASGMSPRSAQASCSTPM